MYFKIQGVVIKESSFGENSKHLSVLTAHRGVIFVTAKGAKKLSSSNFAASQLFAFSDMTLYGNNGPNYTLTEVKLIENFYSLRNDPVVFSLACYFAELASISATVSEEDNELLRLFLNSLWFLQENIDRHAFIKAVFELRLMFSSGYLPDFYCAQCGAEIKNGTFNIETGEFICADCSTSDEDQQMAEVIAAMRYIASCDLKRLFAFTISEDAQNKLTTLAERYLCYRVEGCYGKLSYYKNMAAELRKE